MLYPFYDAGRTVLAKFYEMMELLVQCVENSTILKP